MKYFDMLKAFEWVDTVKQKAVEINNNAEPEKPVVQPVVQAPVQSIVDNSTSEEVLGLLRSIKEQIQVPEGKEKPTLLGETEVDNLLNLLMELERNVFKNTPLSRTLVKQFIWNIPLEVYELSMDNFRKNAPPCMNPMYWFYAFCIDFEGMNTHEKQIAFANAICTATGTMEQADYEEFMDQADEFETLIANEDLDDSTAIPD